VRLNLLKIPQKKTKRNEKKKVVLWEGAGKRRGASPKRESLINCPAGWEQETSSEPPKWPGTADEKSQLRRGEEYENRPLD